MIFEDNPGFIFHDSRGFEAGGAREVKLVQQFIEQRSKARNVNKQLHAIWCVSTWSLGNKCFNMENMFRPGTVFQQVMTNQSLQQKGSSSTNVEQGLVFVILSIYHHEL
jgi:hypothetical protein